MRVTFRLILVQYHHHCVRLVCVHQCTSILTARQQQCLRKVNITWDIATMLNPIQTDLFSSITIIIRSTLPGN